MFGRNIRYEPTPRSIRSKGRALVSALAFGMYLMLGCERPVDQENQEGVFATSMICKPDAAGDVTEIYFKQISGTFPEGGLRLSVTVLDAEERRVRSPKRKEFDYVPESPPASRLVYSGLESPRTIWVEASTVRPDGSRTPERLLGSYKAC